MEICGARNHPMHEEQCTKTASFEEEGVTKFVRCECPEGMSPQIFHGHLLSQISNQLKQLVDLEAENQRLFKLILTGMARAAGVGGGGRIVTH